MRYLYFIVLVFYLVVCSVVFCYFMQALSVLLCYIGFMLKTFHHMSLKIKERITTSIALSCKRHCCCCSININAAKEISCYLIIEPRLCYWLLGNAVLPWLLCLTREISIS